LNFAVVDIETTGLYHQGHGITEVSIVHVDDGGVREAFHRLLDPQRSIPKAVTHLTGITSEMTHGGESVAEVLEEIKAALEDRIFVAHNVNFDYQFLKSAFEDSGEPFRYRRFCTLRYARKVLPELKSHRLSILCTHFGIENSAKHRAYGDAMATAMLLERLRNSDPDGTIMNKLLAGSDHHRVLPANLDERQVLDLPDAPGVYYLFGATSLPIYIGKARSLKRRVLSHFTGAGSSRRKQLFQREVYRIEHREASTEYQALLMEDAEIKRYRPKYNRAQKDRVKGVALVKYEDRKNGERLAILQGARNTDVLAWFTSIQGAKQFVYRSSLEYGFDPRRAGLPLTDDFDLESAEDEPKAFLRFVEDCRNVFLESYALVDTSGGYYALVNAGRYRGYGLLQESDSKGSVDYESALELAPDSPTARAIVRRMLNDERIECIPLK